MGMAKRRGGRLFIKGHSKLGGRVKGTPNKATQALIDAPGVPAQADGDAAGSGPLTVTDAEAPVNVVVA